MVKIRKVRKGGYRKRKKKDEPQTPKRAQLLERD